MRTACFLLLAPLFGCGGHTTIIEASSADCGAAEPPDAGPDDADSPADAGADASADARPALPCHLVPDGEPFESIAFAEPTYSFRHDALLLRRGGSRVVQVGTVEGMRTGVWQDPPMYGAEYDVSTWPPTVTHDPTQLFHSTHEPVDLTELPDGKLALAWRFDNDGQSPNLARYRTLDAASWALGADRVLLDDGSDWTRLEPGPGDDRLVSAYRNSTQTDGGWRVEGWLGSFGFDGAPLGEPLSLWSIESGAFESPMPLHAVARAGSTVLVAIAFAACEGTSPYCEARSIVLLRAANGKLERAGAVPIADPAKSVPKLHLGSDGAGHTWLVWWEAEYPADGGGSDQRYLYGLPIGPDGTPAGPTERWYQDDSAQRFELFAPRQLSVGPLGVVQPVARYPNADAGATTREVHLIHRSLDGDAPVEDVTFETPSTAFPVAVAQVASPRALIVGYSTYAPGATNGRGELRRFVCRED